MPSKRTRRDALRLGGAGLAVLAGCLGDPAGSGPTSTGTETSAGTTEPYATTETFDVTVDEISVAPELVAFGTPDSIATYGERDEQFVVARVEANGMPAPDRSEFAIEAGDDSHAPMDLSRLSYGPGFWDNDDRYVDASNFPIFSLPKPLDASEVVLRWPGGEHALSADPVERLARPPTDFAVREFSAPESVESGEEVKLTVVIENVGRADGTFVGALNRIGPDVAYTPVKGVSLATDAGESVTWTHSYTPPTGDDSVPRMSFNMNWRGGGQSRRISIGSDFTSETTSR